MHFNLERDSAHPFAISLVRGCFVQNHFEPVQDNRQYYADTIQPFLEKEDFPLVKILVKIPAKSLGRISIPLRFAKDVLRELALSKKAIWQRKKLYIDLITIPKLEYRVYNEGEQLKVKGVLQCGKVSFDIKSVDFFSYPYFIHNQILYVLSEPIKWLKKVYPNDWSVSFDRLDEIDGPNVIWMCDPKSLKKMEKEPKPALALRDSKGIFSDLRMEYGQNDSVLFHDFSKKTPSGTVRNVACEKQWEKDLLELGYMRKGTHYYCPTSEFSKNLQFLLELGWVIYDSFGRKVISQTDAQLSLLKEGKDIILKGLCSFESHSCDLQSIKGAIDRQEPFVALSPDSVGLIQSDEAIKNASFEEGQIKLPIFSFGLLKDNPAWQWDEKLVSLRDGKIENFEISKQFNGELFPYQKDAVLWLNCLHAYGLSGILADEMGLGKTVQILAFLSGIKTHLPHLIIMPTSILFQWVKEKERFLPAFSHLLYSGEKREKDSENLQKASIIFTSYGIFYRDIDLFSKLSFECLVLDEAQKIKNPESKTFEAIQKLKSNSRFALTGTPLENKSLDLWTLFEFVMPGFLNSKTFQYEKKKLAPFILRRLKKTVHLDLPPKMESIHYVSMSPQQKGLYEQFTSDFRTRLLQKETGYVEVFEALLRLRQICCHPRLFDSSLEHILEGKFELLINDIEQLTQENHKILVYSQFTQMLALIRSEVESRQIPYVYLDGNTKDRNAPVEAFQNDSSISLFLISLKAGGVGLNLSQADYVLIYDPWWNEAVENQAIDRAHRIGRTKPLLVKRYVAADSIEEKILSLKEKKKNLIQAVLQDATESLSSFSLNDLISLL